MDPSRDRDTLPGGIRSPIDHLCHFMIELAGKKDEPVILGDEPSVGLRKAGLLAIITVEAGSEVGVVQKQIATLE